MDPVRSALCGAAAAVAVCTAPAYAHEGPATMSGTVSLTPVTSTPGSRVQLRVAGCADDKATATSEAFVSDARLAKDSAGLFAETTVRSTTAPGTYTVKVRCDGHGGTAEGRLTIVKHLDERARAHAAHAVPRTPPSPVAPVPAGGGGTAAAADPPGVPGLVLAGGTALAAAAATRHRRRADTGRRR
ncbi:hypothetical protein [Streptomyces blastmyceticus]|uniref:Lipoprotein n=1 Tax=Streptomyces blastmyceticus TaxID=68180 RepID=A0ABN0WA82_9ACTN